MGISGVLRVSWYALFTLMWWIQGVTPATLTVAGLVRSCVSSPWPHLIPGHKFVNPFPKGEWHPCTNLVTWFITLPSCSICCEISSPLTWGKFVDICFIMGGGLPYTVLYGEEPWDCGVTLSLSRGVGNKSTQEQSVSKIHLEGLFKCPVGSFHHPRTLGPICFM